MHNDLFTLVGASYEYSVRLVSPPIEQDAGLIA